MVKMASSYIICHLVVIFEVKLNLSCAKHGFWKLPQTITIFDLWWYFKPKSKPKLECVWTMSREPQILKISFFTLYDKNWPSYDNFRFDLLMTWWRHRWHDDYVKHDLHSYTARGTHLYSCKILFVWHRSFMVNSSGQKSWKTHKHINKQTNKQTQRVNTLSPRYRGGWLFRVQHKKEGLVFHWVLQMW